MMLPKHVAMRVFAMKKALGIPMEHKFGDVSAQEIADTKRRKALYDSNNAEGEPSSKRKAKQDPNTGK